MARIGISLEASSWRGAYVAGILETFGRRGIFPDIVSGSSAGACNGAAYVACNFDLLIDNWIELASEPMFDLRREARRANGGSIFNMSRIFNAALDNGLSAGSLKRLISAPVELLVACTRIAGDFTGSDYWNDRFLVHYPIAS
ncbi:MAG: patatin-like phospholipase family protein, partial [Deltaproteobacteria bacterium]|nr:patatin-like phospholipase family protein [Deltaproteobacteria bacterium]